MVDADFAHATRLAKGDGRAGQALQFDGDMFEDVGQPGALLPTPHEAAGRAVGTAMFVQGGNQGQQRRIEAGQIARGVVFQLFQVKRQTDDRPVGVVVRSTVRPCVRESSCAPSLWLGVGDRRSERWRV